MVAKPSTTRSGARRSCETEYEKLSSSRTAWSSSGRALGELPRLRCSRSDCSCVERPPAAPLQRCQQRRQVMGSTGVAGNCPCRENIGAAGQRNDAASPRPSCRTRLRGGRRRTEHDAAKRCASAGGALMPGRDVPMAGVRRAQCSRTSRRRDGRVRPRRRRLLASVHQVQLADAASDCLRRPSSSRARRCCDSDDARQGEQCADRQRHPVARADALTPMCGRISAMRRHGCRRDNCCRRRSQRRACGSGSPGAGCECPLAWKGRPREQRPLSEVVLSPPRAIVQHHAGPREFASSGPHGSRNACGTGGFSRGRHSGDSD